MAAPVRALASLLGLVAASTLGSGCILAALGAVGAIALASGSGRTESMELSHPAHVGYLEPNRLAHAYQGEEVEYGLPTGTLDDEASLTTLTPAEACFDVRVRNRDEHASRYVDLTQWQVGMSASQDLEMLPTGFVPKNPEAASYMGRRPRQVVNGYTTECVANDPQTRACTRWEERPNYATVYDPATIGVVTGGGTICFAHAGRITPQTEWVLLSLESPDGYVMNFEWEFRDPPAAQAAGASHGG